MSNADMLDYKTERFWLDYPHEFIPYGLKLFYLLQASYWTQQALLLAAGIEKPRKDFKILVAHVSDPYRHRAVAYI
jgi:acyl-CoA-dependent ceramide synthase